MVKAVIFDMDGLMFDSERLSFLGWKNVCPLFGIKMTPKIYLETMGRNKDAISKIFVKRFGSDFDYEKLYKKREAFIRREIKNGFAIVKPGLIELISFLKKRDIKRIIASSAPMDRINYICGAAGVSGDFDEIICGQDAEKGKPAPDIFNLAVEKSGFTKEECIVLEDSINGVKAGLAAGIKTVHIPDKSCLGLWSDELPETPKGAVRADSLLALCGEIPA